METLRIISIALTVLFIMSFSYRFIYMFIRMFAGKKYTQQGKENRFAVLIAARNEKTVIGQLIDSINKQDYPRELIDIYVVADNCTDDTADVARQHGATVYERFDKEHVSKGFALQFLTTHMREDGHMDYDGYFILDADNLLDTHYISAMNNAFSTDKEIVIGYRTAKNYSDNWVSAAYGIYFIYESEFANRPRDLLSTSCFLSGTGCLFSQKFIDECSGGIWSWTGLTEDLECTTVILKKGYKVAYCTDAVLYDEQPTSFAASIKQRIRWVRGYLSAIGKNFKGLFSRLFKKGGFAVFDFLMNFAPLALFILNALADIARYTVQIVNGTNALSILAQVGISLAGIYGGLFVMALVVLVFEWKRIHCPWLKKIAYSLLFPVFMYSYLIVYVGIFSKQKGWEQTEHKAGVTIDELND